MHSVPSLLYCSALVFNTLTLLTLPTLLLSTAVNKAPVCKRLRSIINTNVCVWQKLCLCRTHPNGGLVCWVLSQPYRSCSCIVSCHVFMKLFYEQIKWWRWWVEDDARLRYRKTTQLFESTQSCSSSHSSMTHVWQSPWSWAAVRVVSWHPVLWTRLLIPVVNVPGFYPASSCPNCKKIKYYINRLVAQCSPGVAVHLTLPSRLTLQYWSHTRRRRRRRNRRRRLSSSCRYRRRLSP